MKHLKIEHFFNIEEEVKKFASLEEFKEWKIQIENTEKCNYVSARGVQRLSCGDEKTYYVCNRSGNYKNSAIKRSTKSQGTCKLNRACISQMNMTKKSDGSIIVERQKSHYGHSKDIQHLRISKEDRIIIANKLLQGVPKKRILDSFHTKIGTDIKRTDLLTLKDIENIERDFKLSLGKAQKHKDDAVSIDLWVNESSQGDNSQVLYYKRQGENKDPFEKNDLNSWNDIKEKLTNELSSLNAKIAAADVASVNEDILSQMLAHIRNASNLLHLKNFESDRFVPTSEESSNKNVTKQLLFHSTKKQRSTKAREKKPNRIEINTINDLLSGSKVEFISNDGSNDHKYI